MLAGASGQLLNWHLKRLTDSQERGHGEGLPTFHSLPVPHGEAVEDHIFLAHLSGRSDGLDLLAEIAKEKLVVLRKFAASAHPMTLRQRSKKRHDNNAATKTSPCDRVVFGSIPVAPSSVTRLR